MTGKGPGRSPIDPAADLEKVCYIHDHSRTQDATSRRLEEVEVLRLKVLGWRHIDIADHMGLTLMTVRKRLQKILARHTPMEIRHHRELVLQQYEVLLRVAMEEVSRGNMSALAQATTIVARIADLRGLASPQQLEVQVTQQTQQEKDLQALLDQAARDQKVREERLARRSDQAEL